MDAGLYDGPKMHVNASANLCSEGLIGWGEETGKKNNINVKLYIKV